MNVVIHCWSKTCNRKMLIENTQVCHYCITWITMITICFQKVFNAGFADFLTVYFHLLLQENTETKHSPATPTTLPPSPSPASLQQHLETLRFANNEDSAGMHSGKYTPICLGLNKIQDLSHSRGRNVYWSNHKKSDVFMGKHNLG